MKIDVSMKYFLIFSMKNIDQPQSNELIRRSGASAAATTTLQHHCSSDPTAKVRTIRRDVNQKLSRKDYEIKTLKQVRSNYEKNNHY